MSEQEPRPEPDLSNVNSQSELRSDEAFLPPAHKLVGKSESENVKFEVSEPERTASSQTDESPYRSCDVSQQVSGDTNSEDSAGFQKLAAQHNFAAANLEREDVRIADPAWSQHPAAVQQPAAVPSKLVDHTGTSGTHRSASLPTEDDHVANLPAGATAVTASDLWRSLLWLVTLVLLFLSVISFGPLLVERYQYAAAKGKMQAQYESANDMLSKVSFKDSALASELVVHKIRISVVSVRATSHSSISKFRIQGTGQGSGVILSEDGYIVTNNHVVEGADRIEVTLADRREYVGKVVGRDRDTDLAVIRIDADDLVAAEWGDSNQLELGSAVWAMGSPFGLDQTVTRGIISGKHRRTADTLGNPNPHQDLLQTDAAINPGNSGGPLVNSLGEVIGINTSIYGESFQGISFAVPSTLAKEIVNRLIAKGKIDRGYLGVEPADVTHSDALRLQLPKIAGALLLYVQPNTPASIAGLQQDDVITEWNGNPIENQVLLFRHIGMTEPGSTVQVKFVRDGQLQTVDANVGKKLQNRYR